MDIRQPVTNCATALSSYIQGSLLFSFAFAFGVSLWRLFSRISFGVQTTDEKNPSSWHLSWPPFPSDRRHKASQSSCRSLEAQLGNLQSPEHLILGTTCRYVALGSKGSIQEDPKERNLSTYLSLMEALMWGLWPLFKGTQGPQGSALRPDAWNFSLLFLKSLARFTFLFLFTESTRKSAR